MTSEQRCAAGAWVRLEEPPPDADPRLRIAQEDDHDGPPGAPPAWVQALAGRALTLWTPVQLGRHNAGRWGVWATLPRGVPLLPWLAGQSKQRRRWHAARAAFLVTLFLEQWRERVGDVPLHIALPFVHEDALLLSPGDEALWLNHATIWPEPPPLPRPPLPPTFEDAALELVRGMLHRLLDHTPSAALDVTQLPAAPLEPLDELTLAQLSAPRTLHDLRVALLLFMGGQDPSWLAMPLDRVPEWLRDRSFDQDIAEIGLLFALRPELAQVPMIRDYVQSHMGEELLAPLREGSTPTPVHAALLRLLPGLIPALTALLLNPAAPLPGRLKAAELLGGHRAAEAVQALIQALNDGSVAVVKAARRALERTPEAPPVAWSRARAALIPCSVPWSAMIGDGDLRTCATCQHPVARVQTLDALRDVARTPDGPCVAFEQGTTLTIRLLDGHALILDEGDSVLLGVDPDDDVYIPGAEPHHASLTFEGDVLVVTPIAGPLDPQGDAYTHEPVALPFDLLEDDGAPHPRHGQLRSWVGVGERRLVPFERSLHIMRDGLDALADDDPEPLAGIVEPLYDDIPLAGKPAFYDPPDDSPALPDPPPAQGGLLARIKRFFGG